MAKSNSLQYIDLERLILFIIFLFLAYRFILLTTEVLILFVLVILLFLLLNPVVVFLEKKGITRTWAAIISVGIVLLIFTTILLFALPPVIKQINLLAKELPSITASLLEQVKNFSSKFPFLSRITSQLDLNKILAGPPVFKGIAEISQNLIAVVFFAILSIFLLIFLLSNPKPLLMGFLQFFPKAKLFRVREGIILLSTNLSTWFYSTVLIGGINGIFVGIGFLIIGVKFPLIFAVLYLLAEFIPLVGPLAVAIVAVLFALSQSFITSIFVIILLVIVQVLEATLWSPLILAKRLDLHPLSIVFGVLTAEALLGIVGAILAVPVLLTIKIFYYEFYRREFPNKLLELEAYEIMEMKLKHIHNSNTKKQD